MRRRRQRRRRRRGRSWDIGVVADKREGVAALARPLIHASLDVTGAADFEEDLRLCSTGTG